MGGADYFPTMTEDLWCHALKFLDKYRTDAQNHDISELYQFADQTGVLERHRQLLSQPFNENRVDMKIMYYELIKMLIDYERQNHPHSYDATKTVGKIEGYQELTNKLQRYLNQRFIGDIGELNKTQSKFSQMFGVDSQNINFIQKIENLEQHFSKIEETNKRLVEEIQALKDKELEMSKTMTIIYEKHEEFESNSFSVNQELKNTIGNSEEKFKSMETNQLELSKKVTNIENEELILSNNYQALKEQIEAVDKDGRVFQNNLTNMFNQQKEELEESTKEHISSLSGDLKTAVEDGSALAKEIRETNEKVEKLEQEIPNFSDEYVNKMDTRLTKIADDTDKRFETTEQTIENNTAELKLLLEQSDKNKDEIAKISGAAMTNNDSLAALTTQTHETWQIVESKMENHKKSMNEVQVLVDLNNMKQEQSEATLLLKLDTYNLKIEKDMEILGNQINTVSDYTEKTKDMANDNNVNIKNINAEITKHENTFDTIDSDVEDVKDKLRKAVDNVDSANKTIQVFENRHIETVERMRELTVMTSSIESYVKTQEQKLEQEKANDFNQFNGQLQELRLSNGNISTKMVDLDADNKTLLEKVNEMEKNFQDLDAADKQLLQKLEDHSLVQDSKMNKMDSENKDQVKKIVQIEDAYQLQVQKVQYMDSIQIRLTQIEESKQLTDAKVRDEVDNTLKINQSKIDTIQEDVLQKLKGVQEENKKNEATMM